MDGKIRLERFYYLASSDPELGDCFHAGGLTRGPTSIVGHH